VIAIIGILAAILIPTMIGYVRRAKLNAAISDAQVVCEAAQSALFDQMVIGELETKKTTVINGRATLCSGLSNTALYGAQGGNVSTNASDLAIATKILEVAENANINPGKAPSGDVGKPWGKTGEKFLSDTGANYGLVLLYSDEGEVLFMQIYHNGVLVTYCDGLYVANDSKTATFIKKGESLKRPFTDAGKTDAELSDRIVNSKMPSNW
jgi:type II secretory pathway pseudopilin PulG